MVLNHNLPWSLPPAYLGLQARATSAWQQANSLFTSCYTLSNLTSNKLLCSFHAPVIRLKHNLMVGACVFKVQLHCFPFWKTFFVSSYQKCPSTFCVALLFICFSIHLEPLFTSGTMYIYLCTPVSTQDLVYLITIPSRNILLMKIVNGHKTT
jgi:hypothetical protein